MYRIKKNIFYVIINSKILFVVLKDYVIIYIYFLYIYKKIIHLNIIYTICKIERKKKIINIKFIYHNFEN